LNAFIGVLLTSLILDVNLLRIKLVAEKLITKKGQIFFIFR
jgi:hypothetical protein